jgi:putative ABC transport system permease protein
VRQLVGAETVGVAVPAAGSGIVIASQAGPAVLRVLRDSGVIADRTPSGGGLAALGSTFAIVVTVSVVAASITVRRASRGAPTLALNDARAGTGRMTWWRLAIGVLLILYGVAMAVVTIVVTRHADDPYAAMSTSGSSAVLVGVGLATLAPVLLRCGAALVVPVSERWRVSGWLAVHNTSRRPHLLGSALAPVIVLTATSVGVLMMVGIDHRTIGEGHPESRTINLLNNLITGMVSLFAAIMVVNACAAVVVGRRQELARLRLLGATTRQVHRSVVAEAAIVAAVGVVFGAVASLVTIVPFAVARGEGIVPDGQLWLPPVLLVGAAALTIVAAIGAVRRVGLTAASSR